MKTGSPNKSAKPKVTASSGNVFADLGISQPDVALAKADLAHLICEAIRARKLNQTSAAALLGIAQPKVSGLMCGKLDGFTIERLMKFLNRLNLDIDIVVKSRLGKTNAARTRVAVL